MERALVEARYANRAFIATGLAVMTAVALMSVGCGGAQNKSSTSPPLGETLQKLASNLGDTRMMTISAGGDVNFGDGVTPSLDANGMGYPFENVQEIFHGTDFSFVNLECCISSGGSPVGDKEYTFRGPPGSEQALVDGGIKMVSMANNHSRDYGTTAFLDTLAHLKQAGVAWCGAGKNAAEAYSPSVLESGGRKAAFVAFTGIIPDGWPATASSPGCATTTDRQRVVDAIKAARSKADLVIASFHWGIELATTPNEEQRRLAHLAIDSGADLVLGHHPHVVQGFEVYKNRLIAYSMGNYVFSPPREISGKTYTLVAMFNTNGLVQAKIVPTVISGYHPVIMSGAPAAAWLSTIAGYSSGLGTSMTVTGARGFINGTQTQGKPSGD